MVYYSSVISKKYSFISLSKKIDFDLLKNSGSKYFCPYFMLVKAYRDNNVENNDEIIFYGVKVTKKLGNAVIRNKIKRRLRVLFTTTIKHIIVPITGIYLCIGRVNCNQVEFDLLKKDMLKAIISLNKKNSDFDSSSFKEVCNTTV